MSILLTSDATIGFTMANFRPLQPAPMQEQMPHPEARPSLAQKPKRTVTLGACVACRRRKSKCNGDRPVCSCCTQKETECVYELGPNEKPSQAMKRKNEEMQGELSRLRQLYETLRLCPEDEALVILHKIRSESQLAEVIRRESTASQSLPDPSMQHSGPAHSLTLPPIRVALDSPNTDPRNIPLTRMSMFPIGYDEPSSQRRRHASDVDVSARSDISGSFPPLSPTEAPLHTGRDGFSDIRLQTLANWTSVSKDSQFLVLLMNLWYKWDYSYYHFLDWDIFLDDLSSGATDFCSELLVNAILACASFLSPMIKNRSHPFGDSMITRFYREARRLWETEEGEGDNLTRIQAAVALYLVFEKHGRDKVGNFFLQEACHIAQKLGLFRLPSSSEPRPLHISQDRWDRARSVTAWALFNFQLTTSLTLSMSPFLSSPPPVPIPYEGIRETEDLFRDECARSAILLECLNTLIDPNGSAFNLPPKPEHIEILYLRLKFQFEHRQSSLCPNTYSTPQNLLAAMLHHVLIMRLFQPFTRYESPDEWIQSYRNKALQRTMEATNELRQLIYLHENHIGWFNIIAMVSHPLVTVGFASLDEISRRGHSVFLSERNEVYQGLLTCLNALSIVSTYNYCVQPLLRLLTQSCQSLDIPLPEEIKAILKRFQSEEWTKHAINMASSQYIADTRKVALDLDSARMDSIVSRWGTLTIADEKGSKRR